MTERKVLFSLVAVSRLHFNSQGFMNLIDFLARGLWYLKCKLRLPYLSASAVRWYLNQQRVDVSPSSLGDMRNV